MKSDLARRLAKLPRLDPSGREASAIPCKLCGAASPFFDAVDLNKHCSQLDPYIFGPSGISVPYHRCTACGFLFTTFFDDWSPAEFARHIYNDDYIKVDGEYAEVRPNYVAKAMAEHFAGCENLAILDYGSGTGAFAEQMRRRGFTNIDCYDPFSHPERPQRRYDFITCFEVIEHTNSPLATVLDMKSFLADDGCIIFSQTLQPDNITERLGSWWYLGPRNGHISTFTSDSLTVIAERSGLVFHGIDSPYAFARPTTSDKVARVLGAIGSPVYARSLEAPGPSDVFGGAITFGGDVWHGIERVGEGQMRWTKSPHITWPALAARADLPARYKVLIPVLNEVEPGFSRACTVAADGAALAVRHVPDGLAFELSVSAGKPGVVTLTTPPPLVPRELGGAADDRALGVAVRAAQA